MNRKELTKAVTSNQVKAIITNGITMRLYVTVNVLYRYPLLDDPSKAIGVEITDEDINLITKIIYSCL